MRNGVVERVVKRVVKGLVKGVVRVVKGLPVDQPQSGADFPSSLPTAQEHKLVNMSRWQLSL